MCNLKENVISVAVLRYKMRDGDKNMKGIKENKKSDKG
jgi:hypothetical protein